jgi:hypothetical protein
MNKLTITDKVFVPVSVQIEVPEHKKDVFAFNDKDNWESQCYIQSRKNNKEKWVNSWDNEQDECYPTHWLKEETNKYVLSKEELEKLISDAFDIGIFTYKKKEYINSIL